MKLWLLFLVALLLLGVVTLKITERFQPEFLDRTQIAKMINMFAQIRAAGGRVFILGVGGSAANASHAVNDFRKICGIEAYAPSDNVSELTARVNDEGWDDAYARWLAVSRLSNKDSILVFSVGGGNLERKISVNLIHAMRFAKEQGAKILGIVGRDGGYTAKTADVCVIIPSVDESSVTPHCESYQAVLWHLIISHPKLQRQTMKWESVR
ncbi:MAG: SIS domain-containing protein [Candidatus Omnitrophica bacterium]|nr:SIS domain-containing protein [Candidatus Omnitrophota bacterium]